jgi:hypothetical protein
MRRGPGPKISISENHYGRGDELIVLDNAEFTVRTDNGNEWTVQSRHANGTDFEHDAARIAFIEGSGAVFKGVYGSVLEFTGVLMKAKYYPEDFEIKAGVETPWDGDCGVIEQCDYSACLAEGNEHILMPYMPPKQKVKPLSVLISIEFQNGDNE